MILSGSTACRLRHSPRTALRSVSRRAMADTSCSAQWKSSAVPTSNPGGGMTTKTQLLKTIRAKCLDCSGDQAGEVRLCPVRTCELWPFRMGGDPSPSSRGFSKNPSASRGIFERQTGQATNYKGTVGGASAPLAHLSPWHRRRSDVLGSIMEPDAPGDGCHRSSLLSATRWLRQHINRSLFRHGAPIRKSSACTTAGTTGGLRSLQGHLASGCAFRAQLQRGRSWSLSTVALSKLPGKAPSTSRAANGELPNGD